MNTRTTTASTGRLTERPILEEFSPFKLWNHAEQVKSIAQGQTVFPVTLEIDPTNACDHSCVWCLDSEFQKKTPACLSVDLIRSFLEEAKICGAKGVVFKGGGEPLLHNDYDQMARLALDQGFAVGIVTNGSRISEHLDMLVDHQFLRISLDAGSEATHDVIHRPRSPGSSFGRIIEGIASLVDLRGESREPLIGIKYSVCRENWTETLSSAGLAKQLGVDYISLRPVDLAPHGLDMPEGWPDEEALSHLYAAAKAMETDDFRVIAAGVRKADPGCPCRASHLVAVLAADGVLYACCDLKGRSSFGFGSLHDDSFRGVWLGSRRAEVQQSIAEGACQHLCTRKYNYYNQLIEYLRGGRPHRQFL